MMLRTLFAALLVLFVCFPAAHALEGGEPPAPLCFEGPPDHVYADGRLWVNIQIQELTEPKQVTYFVCDIQTTDPEAFKTALSGDKPVGRREPAADIARRHGAVLAINGDAYGFHRNALIIRNGEVLRSKRTNAYHLLVLGSEGDFSVVTESGGKDGDALAAELLQGGATQVWAFGPALVRDGEASAYDGFKVISPKNSIREPRTAIGQIGPLHYVAVVADGRRKDYSEGMTLQELQNIFMDIGAQTAFNLDGGGSSTLVFLGEVINRPAGGGEREVTDILYFN